MLTEDYLMNIAEPVVKLWEDLEDWAIRDIAERIMAAELYDYDRLPGAARWRTWLLNECGTYYADIIARIAELTEKSEEELASLFMDAGLVSMENEREIYEKHGIEQSVLKKSQPLQRILQGAYEQTKGELRNFTQTTADQSQKRLISELDRAYFEISTGMRSNTEVICELIDRLGKTGLSVTYDSGYTDSLEASVRRSVLTGINQGTARISIKDMEILGCDYVIVSSHLGARVHPTDKIANHAGWQGKIYKVNGSDNYAKNLKEETGYPSNPRGLCGYNCRHDMAPHFKGDPNPFIQYDSEENKKAYEISQKQRRMERAIRKSKKQCIAYSAALDKCQDNDTYKELLKRYERKADTLGRQNKRYIEYSADNNVKTQQERLKVYQWNKDQAAAAKGAAAKYRKGIAKRTKTDILKEETTKEVIDVHTIGKIDRNIYKCITEDIVTDEVIITDEQIRHIKERHPNDYERFSKYFSEIVANPDYIIETNKPDTAVILKEIIDDGQRFQTVLRLCTSKEPDGYKNSIITFLKIDQKRWERYLRTKEILYKKE
ncbi:MAG: PBECR2 nuclease fold domain-containing protein [Roseburia sp.]|nr:PBECR2 nuclease fold domain-containing protein [Roseburia sp.]